jgi:hypothetical protein
MKTSEKDSRSLAAMIVAYKAFGINKELAKEAMVELRSRKESLDSFDYECFIKNELDKLPKSNINPELIKSLSSVTRMGVLS